jgi:hypothetical protein
MLPSVDLKSRVRNHLLRGSHWRRSILVRLTLAVIFGDSAVLRWSSVPSQLLVQELPVSISKNRHP